MVELVVAQRTAHHVTPQAVGIFEGRTPIILLNELFGSFVLALQQIESGTGRSTHQIMRLVGPDAREHHHAMALLFIHTLGGLHKIARAKYVGLVNACHEVGIMKTANGHTITVIALLVHLVHTEHLHLCRRVTIIIGQRSIAFVGHFALTRHHLCHRQTVGTFPHTAHALDICQLTHPLHERGVGSFNHHRIVPLAHIVYAESQIAQSVYIGV